MARHGKKYLEAAKLIDADRRYPLDEAAELLPKVTISQASTRRSRPTCAWASTRATPTSWSEARSCCRMGPAAPAA